MCTVLLPPGVNPIAVNKYIIINISLSVYRAEGHFLHDTEKVVMFLILRDVTLETNTVKQGRT